MKRFGLKFAMLALMVFVGSLSLSAQNNGGVVKGPKGDAEQLQKKDGSCLDGLLVTEDVVIQENGICPCYDLLTPDQQAELDELYADFQADMDDLRAEMQSATSMLEKLEIRVAMKALRDLHKLAVQELLIEWGYI